MKRIFLLIASFPESIVTFRWGLICQILDAGWAVHVACPGVFSSSAVRAQLESRGVVVHEVPLSRTGTNALADIRAMIGLYLLIHRIRPEAVLGYTVKPVIYGTIAAWVARVPRRYSLITGLGYLFTSGRTGLVPSLGRFLLRMALGKNHKVFFQNGDDQKLFKEAGIIPAGVASLVVNGSGVDLAHYAESAPPKDGVSFLMIARLLGDKGVREYVAAAREVKLMYPEAKFRLVGWIDANPDAVDPRELDDWISEGVVEYLGRMNDVRSEIQRCSVYVLPSYREGMPRTVLEAMAMGRAIITTNAPGCRDTVTDGLNGFLVKVRSVPELRDAMLKFFHVPSLATEMGAESRRIAVERFDVDQVSSAMVSEMRLKYVATSTGELG